MRERKPKARQDAQGEAAPEKTREELIHSLHRKLAAVLDRWRECPQRTCRRARRCAHPSLACTEVPPQSDVAPQDDAAFRAHLYRQVKRQLAERLSGEVPPPPRKSPRADVR